MAGKPFNVALIGSKFMGRAHSNAYLKVTRHFDLPLTPIMHTITARNKRELTDFARQWGWLNASDDWKATVKNPDIHLVDVGTPNHVHREQAIAALEAGKHVACEKPLAGTLDDAREMVKAAKKAKKQRTFVWYNYRRCPGLALAYQFAKAGKLGRIYHVRCTYLQDWAGPDVPLLWRFQGDVAGSGSLGDLCAHSIDAARFITGDEVAQVNGAIMETVIKQRDVLAGGAGGEISGKGAATNKAKKGKSTVDDIVVFTARFKGGPIATFEATRLATGYKNACRIEVHGDKGAVRFDVERLCEMDWYDATLPAKEQGWSTINATDGGAGHPYADAWWPTAHATGYEHCFVNQTADMFRILAGAKPLMPVPDFEDAYQTQRVIQAVIESAKHHTPVKLSEVK